MLEILPTPTVSDEKHKSATNRALVLTWSITALDGNFQPRDARQGKKSRVHLMNAYISDFVFRVAHHMASFP